MVRADGYGGRPGGQLGLQPGLFEQLAACCLARGFPGFDLPSGRDPAPPWVEHQQHLGQVRVERPDLGRQGIDRTGTGGRQPAGDVVELETGDTDVSQCCLQRLPLQLLMAHGRNLARECDSATQRSSARQPRTPVAMVVPSASRWARRASAAGYSKVSAG
jgi:hypothetical protein